MITAIMRKLTNLARERNIYTPVWERSSYTRSKVRFFPSEICKSCKEKLNLNKDKFIKEK